MPRTSTLRLTLLHELQNEPAESVTELAARVGKLRPSVSRSLHRLRAQGLVELEGREWQITSQGREEVNRATERLRESVMGLNVLAATTPRVTTPLASVEAFRALDSVVAELNARFRTFGVLPGIEKLWRAGTLNTNSLGLSALFEPQTEIARLLREIRLPGWDFPRWQDNLRRWRPDNLREVSDLNSVATVAREEGIPLSWVPCPEIVAALIDADGPEARLNTVSERRDEILDDCEARLGTITHEWAAQCVDALRALRLGLIGPAQSHAANIVDSIVLFRFGKGGRAAAKGRASGEFGEQLLRRAAEYLTLLPLARALTDWWPNGDAAPPDHFSRHATVHAVGYREVFTPHSATIAVMLATSLTTQFASREAATRSAAQRCVESSPAP